MHALEEVGASSSAGSTQVAEASTAVVRGLSDNAIMDSADWALASTMYSNYVRNLPAGVLDRGSSATIQDVSIDWLACSDACSPNCGFSLQMLLGMS